MSPASPRPATGDAAPPFSLVSHSGAPVKLVDFRGKQRVILAFHGQGEGNELKTFEAHQARLRALRTQVLGVGGSTPDVQARAAARLGLHFPLLSDASGAVSRLYGVRRWPLFARRTFVIDGAGVLRLVLEGPPDVSKIEAFLEALRGDLPGA